MFYDKLQQGEIMPTKQQLSLKFLYTLWFLIGVNFLFVIWTLFASGIIVCDDIEHMRAAYFVSLGHVPYRDFFEHHHPLLWYALWPLIKILPHSTIISLYIGRALSLLVSLGTGYYFYQIMKHFVGGKIVAALAVVLYFTGMPSWYSLINIKPDIYMRLFYFMGLYELFCYFRQQKIKNLCLCAIAWMVGFLFLQTITLNILPLIPAVIWFLYKNPQKITDFLLASILPLLMFAGFCGLLYAADTLADYYTLNWEFNSKMTGFLHQLTQSKYLILFADSIFISVLAAVMYLKTGHKNIYMLSLLILFTAELLQRIFWVSLFSQYYVMFFAFAAMITAPAVYKLWRQSPQLLFWSVTLFAAFHLFVNWLCLQQYVFIRQPFYYLEKHHIPPEQTYGLDCGIYQPKVGYYWALLDVEALHNMWYNRDPEYNINNMVNNPKVRFYCSSGLKRTQKFLELTEELLSPTEQQRQIIKRHTFNNDFYQNFKSVERRLHEKRHP